MTFTLTLTIKHWAFAPITKTDTMTAKTKAAMLKKLALSSRCICELKNHGETTWKDEHGTTMILELKQEAH